ncbi:oxidative stress-induced growth inhibitor 2-like isoform X1 [Dreissena polymorpha]|uniref:oxidative stress-induced growth inhibitor 2-like isoform X1 n=1 Tax=Dreissena polymorpha TaxID=45954 RepID=UPI002264B96B|nr:oxidative stress-induced growth inhibitor 2-like isoform X1 [Dreissena polymorpha]XP_052248109.1 oxidative stress-induced growth inhibitor 2-like isoform X1 [Dreissena polymorpha]XP_052248110.1 oxidative stress-induced growth inhibitor 2-like isoform X1 [Dreissena polymorpha]XP_052248111.1 oxidative stress-induced growth inhibitor 2-like isoform X1 [Dreissena polymorpha]XP_052248112.1 oxidative stress-induced growth inhibitor 2-like isoform X1 [Dreissena polymorpha]XP_052248113.1 oxidative 
MPISCSKSQKCTDVVIIGNGPSGICLSYMLSGYRPYYTGQPHPNPMLNARLQEVDRNISLVEQDLEFLSEGLEGRSSNPVAVLFDALSHPDADQGADNPSLLRWRYEENHMVEHMVLGKSKPGGSWQAMEGSMQTLSLSSWMELPNLPFQKWLKSNHSSDRRKETNGDRATISDVCNYYTHFVNKMNIQNNFYNGYVVTSVKKVHTLKKTSGKEDKKCCCAEINGFPYFYEVKGYYTSPHSNDIGATKYETCEEFSICSKYVVLATGTFDVPNTLSVPGETLDFVSHSLHEFESVINQRDNLASNEPVMVVGAGLSAADAILISIQNQVPIYHAFRRGANDPSLILRKLPKNMYPEYHKVHMLMKGSEKSPFYKSFEKQGVVHIEPDKTVILKEHKKRTDETMSVKVSHVAVFIGSRPDLSFLPHEGRDLGVVKKYPIESKHNPIDIDPYSYQSMKELGLFAMGPLVGDNFVRFGQGGALGITNYLTCKSES